MKEYVEDLVYSLRISLIVFAILFALGCIVGVIVSGFNLTEIALWGCKMVQYGSMLGLAMSGISFMKRDGMRPLNYQRQWEMYFLKFNLIIVILVISVSIAILSYSIETMITF